MTSSAATPAVGARPGALDWVATGAAVGGVFAALLTFDLAQRIAIRFGPRAHQRAVSGMARAINLASRLSGAKLVCEGLEHVDFTRNYLVVSNHQSLLDISQSSEYLAALAPRYVSKRELARGIPGVSYNLAHGGSACIDRRDPEQARAAIEELGRHVREDGWTAVIYPEGTRSRDGRMRPWKTGGLRTLVACAPGVPILPVTSSGGSRLFAHGMKPLVRGVTLSFKIHPPMPAPDPHDDAAFEEFVRRCQAIIEGALPRDAAG